MLKILITRAITVASIATLSACSTTSSQATPPLPVKPNPEASAMTPCQPLQRITNGDTREIIVWISQTVADYRDCASKQQYLVKYIKQN